MMNYKTKKKITLVLACGTLVAALSSCSFPSTSNAEKVDDTNYDEEIHQILEDNLRKFEIMNQESKETDEQCEVKTTNVLDSYVFNSAIPSAKTSINLSIIEYGEIVNPSTFCDDTFLNFLTINNIKLGEEISSELFKNVYNIDLSTFSLNYAAGLYTSGNYIIDNDILNMILILKYNKYVSDLSNNSMFISYNDIVDEINNYYNSNNIDLKWNEVPSSTNTFQRSLTNN